MSRTRTKRLLPWLLLGAQFVAGTVRAETVHVLAVGTNRGLPSEAELAYAESDAQHYAETLQTYGRLDRQQARVLTGGGPTEVLDALAALSTRASVDDVVHFYYSGHGDRRSLHVNGERLNLSDLRAALDAVPARVRIVILDACQSATDLEKGLVPEAPFSIDLGGPDRVSGTVLLRAASAGEAAQESSELGGAVFTHALLVGLRGAADVDADGRVSLSELYRHAYRQTVLRSSASPGEVMHPTVDIELAGAGELIVSQIRDTTASVLVPPARDRQYLLFARPSGALTGELWADPRRPVVLPLPPGRYLVHRRGQGRTGARELSLEAGQEISLEQGSFRDLPLALLVEKGGRLRLRTHELTVAAGAHYRLGLGQFGRLGWSFGSPQYRGAFGVGVGRSSYSGSNQSFETLELESELLFIYRVGAFDLAGGAFGRVLQVRGQALAAELLGPSLPTETSTWGAGFGPRLRGGWELLETGSVAVDLSLTGSLLAAPETSNGAESWTLRPEVGLELGVRWESP